MVSEDELDATVASWIADLVAQPPLAVRAAKRTMRLGLDTTFEANAYHVMQELLTLFRTKDFTEAVSAYVEKRPPNFQGR